MTLVQLRVADPRSEAFRGEAARVLRLQGGPLPGWGERAEEDLAPAGAGPYDAWIRATDEEDRLLGGALLLDWRLPGEAHSRPLLLALWVAPEVRSRGLGRRLARKAQEVARERGARELVALVPPDDDAAVYWSERLGFSRELFVVSLAL